MTPADILAAARLSPLSPVVPAREEWLEHWVGPVLVHRHHPDVPAGFWDDGAYIGGWADSGLVRTCDQERMRLDLHRREVRDRMMRCGAPEWCRDSVAGALAVATGTSPFKLFPKWHQRDPRREDFGRVGANDGRYLHVAAGGHMSGTLWDTDRTWIPWWRWNLSRFDGHFITVSEGRESTPDAAKAAADLAALHAGCVLEEADGWYIPLPGGAVGWLPKESA